MKVFAILFGLIIWLLALPATADTSLTQDGIKATAQNNGSDPGPIFSFENSNDDARIVTIYVALSGGAAYFNFGGGDRPLYDLFPVLVPPHATMSYWAETCNGNADRIDHMKVERIADYADWIAQKSKQTIADAFFPWSDQADLKRNNLGKSPRDYAEEDAEALRKWFASLDNAELVSQLQAAHDAQSSTDWKENDAVYRSQVFKVRAPSAGGKTNDPVIDGSNVPKMLVYPGDTKAADKAKADEAAAKEAADTAAADKAAADAKAKLQPDIDEAKNLMDKLIEDQKRNAEATRQKIAESLRQQAIADSEKLDPLAEAALKTLQDISEPFVPNQKNFDEYLLDKFLPDTPSLLQIGTEKLVDDLWDNGPGMAVSRGGLLGDWMRSRGQSAILDKIFDSKISLQAGSNAALDRRLDVTVMPDNIMFGLRTWMFKQQDEFRDFFITSTGLISEDN